MQWRTRYYEDPNNRTGWNNSTGWTKVRNLIIVQAGIIVQGGKRREITLIVCVLVAVARLTVNKSISQALEFFCNV